jgi:putative toxin-antitoxin system antitoxin component (TIGR02293 family)
MKKKQKNIPYKPAAAVSKVQEPPPVYRGLKALPLVKDFTYKEFKKIADKAPFTQVEWAAILHISERTLQRYAKDNSTFSPINAERAVQVARVLKEGEFTFGKAENFYSWIKSKPYMLEGNLSFDSLTNYDGIQKVLTQLGRIQHGILA